MYDFETRVRIVVDGLLGIVHLAFMIALLRFLWELGKVVYNIIQAF